MSEAYKEKAKYIEREFLRQVDTWFSKGMGVWDNELDRQIAKWYSEVEDVFPKRPYFSPSSLNSCPLELYLKAKGKSRDNIEHLPHIGRWQRLGGIGGDMLQREILMMERHYERVTGEPSKFKFVRNTDGTPMFEEFAKKSHPISIDGEAFYLFGAPDGIMEFTDDDGSVIRVGLEVKSKQTTNARTSAFSMREAETSHYVQSVAYAEMYDCEYYIIAYINYSKKGWFMTAEDYNKTPDFRAFCYYISEQEKFTTLLYPAEVQKAVNSSEPPKLDITKYTFNNFKQACADALTDEDMEQLEEQVKAMMDAPMKKFLKDGLKRDLNHIKELRGK